MSKFSEMIKKRAQAGGEYISVNNLINEYPGGVTITGIFPKMTPKGEVTCMKFAEAPDRYFFATGGDLKLTVEEWLEYCGTAEDGGYEVANELLAEEPVKIKIYKIKTKNGNTYTKVSLAEED